MVRLGDLCTKSSSNIAQKDLENCNGEYPIYGASGFIKCVNFYMQEHPYIAVVKDGAGVGRVMKLPEKTSVIGTIQYIIPNSDIDVSYLAYAMENMNLAKYYSGATIPHIYFKDYSNETLPEHSSSEQKHIAAVLDKVTDLIAKQKRQLELLDELVKARFVEMFGDPVDNPMKWDTKLFLDIGKCKNGMNFHFEDSGVEIHCLGVGDFKDLSIINDTSTLPKILLNKMPTEEYLLKNGDIVFVRSNGNQALVGRSLAIYPNNISTTFSGFCIRFRKESDSIIIPYLLRVLKTDSIRQKMIGRGANIQNLNQKILSTLEIPIPPIDLQNQFADFVTQTDKTKSKVKQTLEKAETLKKALMQKYFG